jgi:hypothetical protein
MKIQLLEIKNLINPKIGCACIDIYILDRKMTLKFKKKNYYEANYWHYSRKKLHKTIQQYTYYSYPGTGHIATKRILL